MRELVGRVAVITGGASGIGRGMADRFARAGMKIVLADVEVPALERAAAEMRAAGAEVLPVVTDVSRSESVTALAQATVAAFGGVHLICSNAGIVPQGRSRRVWEHPLEDWTWALGVNLLGMAHVVRIFVPILLAQKTEGHVVFTGSVSGLISSASGTLYGVSKFGVVRLAEGLLANLRDAGAPIGVTLVSPGLVQTNIRDAERNRPAALRPADGLPSETASYKDAVAAPNAMTPAQVAELVHDAVRDDRFYVFTSEAWDEAIRNRTDDMLARRNPRFPDVVDLLKKEAAALPPGNRS